MKRYKGRLGIIQRVLPNYRALFFDLLAEQVEGGLSLFAMDHNEMFPESVATVGFGDSWNWSDPMKMIGNRTPRAASVS